MSDLQRSFAKAKLSNLPFAPPVPLNDLGHNFDVFDETEEDEDHLKPLPSPNGLSEDDSSSASSASSVSSAGTIIPSSSQRLFARGKGPPSTSRFAPLLWTDFFAQEISVTPDHPARITHHIYLTPPSSQNGPLFVMHHGAGSSALSFAAVTGHILRQLPTAGVLAIDARGHGETHVGVPEFAAATTTTSSTSSTNGAPVLDLSLTALSGDLERAYDAAREYMGWSVDLPVILVGHSLGGAVVATVAKEGRLAARLLGFAVFDVVEGSAMDALQSMQGYLATRPRSFASIDEGIEWHLRSRTIRTAVSARASVPALLKPEIQLPAFHRQGSFGTHGGRFHAGEPSAGPSASAASKGGLAPPPPPRWPGRRRSRSADSDSDMTDNDDANGAVSDHNGSHNGADDAARQRWTWRTDLAATQPFWEGWFVGLSAKFLTARGAKLLLLAGTDRLDKELMIGQMQGKYQLQVFPDAGHFVHEDAPDRTATVLVDFWRRNDGSRLVLPPKVAELLARGQRV